MPAPTAQSDVARTRQKLPRMRSSEVWYYFGPAFVASIAYIDPGNFATNFDGGARFGYKLLWVLLWSNAMAILIQYLAAKLGIATGRTLPQNCRDHFSRPTTIGLWVAAEISALATDMAEFLGAALGFYLLGRRMAHPLWLEQNRNPSRRRYCFGGLRLRHSCAGTVGLPQA